jgi:hypothetical protein
MRRKPKSSGSLPNNPHSAARRGKAEHCSAFPVFMSRPDGYVSKGMHGRGESHAASFDGGGQCISRLSAQRE